MASSARTAASVSRAAPHSPTITRGSLHVSSRADHPARAPTVCRPPGFCPFGDDPLTACRSANTASYQEIRYTLGSAVKWDPTAATQTVTYTLSDEAMDYFGTGGPVGSLVAAHTARSTSPGQMRITFRDQNNGSYTAHGVSNVFALTANVAFANDALEAALESLPAQKVSNVVVTSKLTTTADNGGIDYVPQRRYVVTFLPDVTSSTNVGVQKPLQCDTGYSCTEAGCQPMVSMPFLYRYAGMSSDMAVGTPLALIGVAGANNIQFYTGNANDNTAWSNGNFVRLHASSQPQMPFNVPVDTGVTSATLARYDIRILVAVIDPANNLDDLNDLVYVRVIAGHTNITSNLEAVGYSGWPAAPSYTGVWGATTPPALGGAFSPSLGGTPKPWYTGLSGFTALGPIVADANGELKFAVPGAPGAFLHFGKTNIVSTDGLGRWYEILIKLPSCSVKVLASASDFTDINGGALAPVDSQVENVECSNRGQCDRTSGSCSCFQGFAGKACHKQFAGVA